MPDSKIAIVTGGSRGIGAATARKLSALGFSVCINYVSDSKSAQEVAKELRAQGGRAMSVRADVSQESDVDRLFALVDDELGTVTALVNNAGILRPQLRVEDMTADRINAVLSVNVTSAFLCSKLAIKRMSKKHGGGGGAIVNVSSAASRLGAAGEYVDYAASKGAIDSLTIGLAKEVADSGIRVNCVRPGFIYTSMHADGGEPERIDRVAPSIPLKRGGQPEEVANAIAWLLSEEASYVTGAFIDAAGGR